MMHKSSTTMMYDSLPRSRNSMVTVTAVHDEFIFPKLYCLTGSWQNDDEQARGKCDVSCRKGSKPLGHFTINESPS